MVYHSYIDFMLEVQIRRANEDLSKAAYNSMVAFTETEFNLNENEKRITRTDEVKTLLQAFTISNHLSTFYEYPLLEWLDTK